MSNQNESSALQICCSTSSNKKEIFKCERHFLNISKKLCAFYGDAEFFDIILIAGIDNFELEAHRIILSASSDYFLAMFRNHLKEHRSTEVELQEIDGATLKLIVDYMYTASIELCSESVETILRAADFFQMDTLIAACCSFMGQQLDVSNCLGIALFAEQHGYKELYKQCIQFAYEHFEEVCGEKEFYQLNEEQLTKFIINDHRYMRSEEKLFLALMSWVQHDKANREKLLTNILSHVRFALLKPKFIVENRPSIGKSIESDELIFSWLQWHLSPETRTVLPIEQKKSKKLVFVADDEDDFFRVSIFNSELNFWSYDPWPRPSIKRTNYSTVVINNKLIIAGGMTDTGFLTSSVECLDLETMEWKCLAPMLNERTNVGIAEIGDCVYFVGGFNGQLWTKAVEVYNFAENSWKEVAPLPNAFEDIQVAVLFGVIYAATDSDDYDVYYDPDMDEWTDMSPKNEVSIMFGIAAVGEYLYVVGGNCGDHDSNTVERYDPSKDSWTNVNPLILGRQRIKCVALNNRLVACGGTYNDVRERLVEEYNPKTNEWTSLAPLILSSDTSHLFTV